MVYFDDAGSPYREPISTAILRLQEKTVLTELKNKWWKRMRGGGQCDSEKSKKGGHNELGLQNVGGVFVVLVGGLGIAFVISILEFIHKSRKNAEDDRVTPIYFIPYRFLAQILCT